MLKIFSKKIIKLYILIYIYALPLFHNDSFAALPREINTQKGNITLPIIIDYIPELKQNLNILFDTETETAINELKILGDYWTIPIFNTKIYKLDSSKLLWQQPNSSSILLRLDGNRCENSTWEGSLKGNFIYIYDKASDGYFYAYKSGQIHEIQTPKTEKLRFKYKHSYIRMLEYINNTPVLEFTYSDKKEINKLTSIKLRDNEVKFTYGNFRIFDPLYNKIVNKDLLSKIEMKDGRSILIEYTASKDTCENEMRLDYYYLGKQVFYDIYRWKKDGTPVKINKINLNVFRVLNDNKRNKDFKPYKKLHIEYSDEALSNKRNSYCYDFDTGIKEEYYANDDLKIITTYRKMHGYAPILIRKLEVLRKNSLFNSYYYLYDENNSLIRKLEKYSQFQKHK